MLQSVQHFRQYAYCVACSTKIAKVSDSRLTAGVFVIKHNFNIQKAKTNPDDSSKQRPEKTSWMASPRLYSQNPSTHAFSRSPQIFSFHISNHSQPVCTFTSALFRLCCFAFPVLLFVFFIFKWFPPPPSWHPLPIFSPRRCVWRCGGAGFQICIWCNLWKARRFDWLEVTLAAAQYVFQPAEGLADTLN